MKSNIKFLLDYCNGKEELYNKVSSLLWVEFGIKDAVSSLLCTFVADRMMKDKAKTGHWIKTPKAVMGEGYMWYCDNCEHQVYQDSSRPYPSEKYCPNCGCAMEKRGKEQKE